MRAVNSFAEKKYYDMPLEGSIGTSGFLTSVLVPIVQGTTSSTRIGNKIKVRYIIWSIDLDSENETELYWRIALLRSRTAGLVLADVPSGETGHIQFIDIEKWEIISDKTFSLGSTDGTGENKVLYKRSHRIFRTIVYDQGSAQPITNNFYIWGWTNDVVTTGTNIRGNARVYYTDV